MGIEASGNSFYPTTMPMYIILRYLLITVTYFLFSKDYKSVAQSVLLFQQFPEIRGDAVLNLYYRLVNIIANELVVYWIIVSTDIGVEGGLGLIINFSSAILICELDDIIVQSARVHNLRERFDELEESCSSDQDDEI